LFVLVACCGGTECCSFCGWVFASRTRSYAVRVFVVRTLFAWRTDCSHDAHDRSRVCVTLASDTLPAALSAHDELLIDAIAHRLLALLDERETHAQHGVWPHVGAADGIRGMVDAQTVAQALGVARSTVYEHADELGARHVGHGARPRLRFDLDEAVRAWTRRSASERSQPAEPPVSTGVQRRRRSARLGSSTHLLPIKRAEAAQ